MNEVKHPNDQEVYSKGVAGHNFLRSISPVKCLLALAILYTLYFAQTLVLIVLLTVLIALLLDPWVRLLKRLYVPRAVSAVVLLSLLIMPFSFLAVELTEPVQKWIKLIPKLSVQLTEQIDVLSEKFQVPEGPNLQSSESSETQKDAGFKWFGWFESTPPEPVITDTDEANVVTEHLKESSVSIMINMLSATPMIIAQILSCFILILFLLIFSPALFEAFTQSLPSPQQKDRAVHLVNAIQKELSRYIITVSSINAALGIATAGALHFIGMEDALLWGVLVGLLNFMPYLGAAIGAMILILASAVQYGLGWGVFIPVSIYLTLNLIESQFITPTILGHRMKINPLVVMMWLLTCAWLWGMIGVLLAVPLLVCIKLVLSQLGIWKNAIYIMEAGG